MSGTATGITYISASGDTNVDGLLTYHAWTGTLSYSFPTDDSVYVSSPGSFRAVSDAQVDAARFALDADRGSPASAGFSVEGFTNLSTVQDTTPDSNDTIRLGGTLSYSVGTAEVADFPGNYVTGTTGDNGDVWFGPYYGGYRNPVAGNYEWATHLHELGHALGLKHAHDAFGYAAVDAEHDRMEYTLMSYRSYRDASVTSGYTNETFGYAQSFMMLDIAALQHMYGADFSTNSGDTVYKWTPGSGQTLVNGAVAIAPGANRIFATIWDGGGTDTYDLSAYSTALDIDLRPGEASLFSPVQQAYLGNGNYAQGNIYNALQYQGDSRSLIENAIGGSGNDTFAGNAARNTFHGGDGEDTLRGYGGDDVLYGEGGDDRLVGNRGNDRIYGGDGNDRIFASSGTDTIMGNDGNDVIYGNSGRNEMRGGNGNDKLLGGRHGEWLYGGDGNDLVAGRAGHDKLRGNSGDDRLFGGKGNDLLVGGSGSDTFIFRDHSGYDKIRDFDADDDDERIDLSDVSSITSFNDLRLHHMTQEGRHVEIDAGGGNVIVIMNTQLSDLLDGNDFIF